MHSNRLLPLLLAAFERFGLRCSQRSTCSSGGGTFGQRLQNFCSVQAVALQLVCAFVYYVRWNRSSASSLANVWLAALSLFSSYGRARVGLFCVVVGSR